MARSRSGAARAALVVVVGEVVVVVCATAFLDSVAKLNDASANAQRVRIERRADRLKSSSPFEIV
jgi:hypothetical protein